MITETSSAVIFLQSHKNAQMPRFTIKHILYNATCTSDVSNMERKFLIFIFTDSHNRWYQILHFQYIITYKYLSNAIHSCNLRCTYIIYKILTQYIIYNIVTYHSFHSNEASQKQLKWTYLAGDGMHNGLIIKIQAFFTILTYNTHWNYALFMHLSYNKSSHGAISIPVQMTEFF